MLGDNSYVTIILTKRCSLKCNYCFEDAGPMGEKDWDLDTLKRCLAEARDVGYKWVAITGGDPPTHPEFEGVLSVVENSGLNLFLETNGVLVTTDLTKRLAKFQESKELRIQTSLDSVDSKKHDRWRGQGAHKAAVRSIRKMVSHGLKVHVCKVIMPDDFQNDSFNIDSYIDFCKSLDVARIEIVRSVPMGRGTPDDYRISQKQLRRARTYLETREEYGGFIVSTHFNHVDPSLSTEKQERSVGAKLCRRLSGDDPGIVINPDPKDKSNWKLSPCAFLQDIEIGRAGDLLEVVEGRIQKRMEGIRNATMIGFEPETVWGCTECRPRFLKVLNEMQRLKLEDSAKSFNQPVPVQAEKDIVR